MSSPLNLKMRRDTTLMLPQYLPQPHLLIFRPKIWANLLLFVACKIVNEIPQDHTVLSYFQQMCTVFDTIPKTYDCSRL